MLNKPPTKSTRLTTWEMAIVAEAMYSYRPPGFTETAMKHYQELVEKINHATIITVSR